MRGLFVLAFVLSGCFGMCGPTVTDVTWTDRAMFDALDGTTTPATGFDIGSDEFAAARVAHAGRERDTIWLGADGLRGYFIGDEGLADASAQVRPLLENVTDLDGPAIDSIISELIAGAEGAGEMYFDGRTTPMYDVHADVDAPIDLSRLLAAHPGLSVDNATATGYNAFAEADGWTVDYDAATRHRVADDYSLTANAFGFVSVDGPWHEDQPEEDVEAGLRAWLDAQGLPAPEHMEMSVVVC